MKLLRRKHEISLVQSICIPHTIQTNFMASNFVSLGFSFYIFKYHKIDNKFTTGEEIVHRFKAAAQHRSPLCRRFRDKMQPTVNRRNQVLECRGQGKAWLVNVSLTAGGRLVWVEHTQLGHWWAFEGAAHTAGNPAAFRLWLWPWRSLEMSIKCPWTHMLGAGRHLTWPCNSPAIRRPQ